MTKRQKKKIYKRIHGVNPPKGYRFGSWRKPSKKEIVRAIRKALNERFAPAALLEQGAEPEQQEAVVLVAKVLARKRQGEGKRWKGEKYKC